LNVLKFLAPLEALSPCIRRTVGEPVPRAKRENTPGSRIGGCGTIGIYWEGHRLPPRLTRQELLRLARLGAHARLAELRAEVAAIEALLGPGTPKRKRGRPAKVNAQNAQAVTSSARRRARRKPRWTAAQRQAVAERMRAYWAKRKAGLKK
jgi:hypothetical protein